MCEELGSDPVEEEIPLDRNDLSIDTQEVLQIYDFLPSRWEGMSATYLGKDLSRLNNIFLLLDTDIVIKKFAIFLVPIIDNLVSKDIQKKQDAERRKQEVKNRSKF